jgi:hypothetical protein
LRSNPAITALRTLRLSNGGTSMFIEIQRVLPAGRNVNRSLWRFTSRSRTAGGGPPASQHKRREPLSTRRAATARFVLPSSMLIASR